MPVKFLDSTGRKRGGPGQIGFEYPADMIEAVASDGGDFRHGGTGLGEHGDRRTA